MQTLSDRLSCKKLTHGLGMLNNTLLKNKPLQFEHMIYV